MDKNIKPAENAENGFFDISGVKNVAQKTLPESSLNDTRHVADDEKESGDASAKEDIVEKKDLGKTKPEYLTSADAADTDATSSADLTDSERSDCDRSEAEKEDEEFSALIKGKYRDAYRRRTENIIRKRLKNAKVKSPVASEISSLKPKRDAERSADFGAAKEAADTVQENKASVGNNVRSDKAEDIAFADTSSVGTGENGSVTEPTEKEGRSKNVIDLQRNVNRTRPRENGVGGSVGMFTGINVSALNGHDVLELLRRAENGEKIKFRN